MSDPRRILDENEGDDGRAGAALKRSMLRAAQQETSIPDAQARLLSALGLDDSAVSARPPARPRRERAAERWAPPPLFASSLLGEELDPRRYGFGALVSTMAHAAVFALALHGMSRATAPRSFAEEPRAMVQLTAKAAELLPPGAAKAPLGEPSPLRDPRAIMAPPEHGDRVAAREIEGSRAGNPAVRVSSPDEIATAADSRSPAMREARIPAAPDRASAPGAALPLPSSEILPFGEGMNLPRLIDGPVPVYPRAAREARAEVLRAAGSPRTFWGGSIGSCCRVADACFSDVTTMM